MLNIFMTVCLKNFTKPIKVLQIYINFFITLVKLKNYSSETYKFFLCDNYYTNVRLKFLVWVGFVTCKFIILHTAVFFVVMYYTCEQWPRW